MLKNDLKLCVNHQFIAPSLYNQITQLIFITDIFRPKIKYTTLFGGLLCLYKVSRFLSKLLTDHATETIFGGVPCRRFLSPRVSPSCAPVFSCAHYFQAPATQASYSMLYVKGAVSRNSAKLGNYKMPKEALKET